MPTAMISDEQVEAAARAMCLHRKPKHPSLNASVAASRADLTQSQGPAQQSPRLETATRQSRLKVIVHRLELRPAADDRGLPPTLRALRDRFRGFATPRRRRSGDRAGELLIDAARSR